MNVLFAELISLEDRLLVVTYVKHSFLIFVKSRFSCNSLFYILTHLKPSVHLYAYPSTEQISKKLEVHDFN